MRSRWFKWKIYDNTNWINTEHVTSCFWETKGEKRILNVFLTNGKTFNFDETTGEKFLLTLEM